MAKTSIHFAPVKPGSEIHNERKKELPHVFKEHSHLNESWLSYETATIDCERKKIEETYQATTGQRMQKKATPIREGVIVIDDNTTLDELKAFSGDLRQKFGIRVFQIHIHRDEGHIDKTRKLRKNLHAHLVCNWTDPNTGKSLKLGKEDMSEIQTMAAKWLRMERGQSSSVKHLDAVTYKAAAKKKEVEQWCYNVVNTAQMELEGIKEIKDTLKDVPTQFTDYAQKVHKFSFLDRLDLFFGLGVFVKNITIKKMDKLTGLSFPLKLEKILVGWNKITKKLFRKEQQNQAVEETRKQGMEELKTEIRKRGIKI